MKINEKKLIEYLERNVGENTTTCLIAKECSVSDDDEMDFETDLLIRRIAEENSYRLNADHHAYEDLGLPWAIDFYIEIADVEKDIEWIERPAQMKMRTVLIESEYGIRDDEKGMLVGFRKSIPWQVKKIYDEYSAVIDGYEKNGIIID